MTARRPLGTGPSTAPDDSPAIRRPLLAAELPALREHAGEAREHDQAAAVDRSRRRLGTGPRAR